MNKKIKKYIQILVFVIDALRLKFVENWGVVGDKDSINKVFIFVLG